MSLKAMSITWDAPIKPPSLKLVALALADWSNDDGGSLHPSMASIARKTGIGRCQAQRLIQTMKAAGVLSVLENQYGGKPGDTPRYQLHLDRIKTWTGSADATGSATDTGSADARRGVAPMHKRGSADATQTVIEPSLDTYGESHDSATSISSQSQTDTCPHQDIISLFHSLVPTARRVRDWTPARATLLRARWREDAKRQNLEWWRKFFSYVAESKFLTGQTSTPGRKAFELGLEWLLKAENFAKVREGAYHDAQDVEVAA